MPAREQEPLSEFDREEIAEVLAMYSPLFPSGIPELSVLSGGYLNRSYLIVNGASQFVLRNYKFNTQRAAIAYEHELLQHLPRTVNQAAIAKPLRARHGGTIVSAGEQHYALFPYLKGTPFGRGNLRSLENAGRTLAAYHNAVRGYVPRTQQRATYGTVAHLDWVARHGLGLQDLWQHVMLSGYRSERERRINDGIGFLVDEARQIEKALGGTTYASLPQLVIHNDFGPQNLLRVGDDVVGILDFDLVAWDARVYDLATALTWLGEDIAASPPYAILSGDRAWTQSRARAQAVFRGYITGLELPLTRAEIEILPWMLRAFGMWLAVWYLDLRRAGKEWYPEELSGLLEYLKWLRSNAVAYVSQVIHDTAGEINRLRMS